MEFMLYGRGIIMNQNEKNELLANDLKKFLLKHDMIDTRIYFNGKCFDFNSSGEVTTLEDIKGSTYFEYANDETVSMSFEGRLNHVINGYISDKKVMNGFDKIFEKHNCYYELGYAWSLSVYYN
jgi:outer membrane protein assembly factor BamB